MKYYRRFLPFLKPYLPRMLAAAGLVAVVALINLVLIRLVGRLWDVVTVQRNETEMNHLLALFLLLVLAQGIFSVGHGYLAAWISQHLTADFRRHVFRHLQSLSLGFFAKRRTGELLSRLMNDIGVIQNIATDTPIDLAKQAVTLIGGIAFLLVTNWQLCVLILLLLPALVLVAKFFGRRLKRLSTAIQDRTATLSTIIEEVLSGIRVVKSFVRTSWEEARFAATLNAAVRVALKRAVVMAVFVPTITLLTFAAGAAVLWYGGRQVIQGQVSPGDLFAFVLFAGILIGPFGAAARVFAQIKEAQGAMQRVFEILDTQPEVSDGPDAQDLPPVRGQMRLQHVSFQYDSRQVILHDVSLEANPGEVVALVGPTGAGKTTVINLLHRFYDPSGGAITVDGHDLRHVRLDSWYRQVALVPQETVLFGGTILDNIRYGREDATEADVLAASEAALADEFITRLPDGYQTVVGEKGVNLSGGQRQRIAIARAILKNPRVLLLDEATSALDTESERLVQQALDRLMAGRTTFVVAHRLTTVQKAHRIIVLDKGAVVESGTHAELIERRGLYHYLATLRQTEDELRSA
ncbi:ABC transporter ATP-binding protein [Nitrospira tepida]|uniref:ABC transporter ATP-binding protein n=1 Tax=Nitrospira tepida TaxID=2973512 RepID=A0AA86N2I1_9BACT|nr:ABC transporter ATP-binding protein [Nitrospira tepida]CAI4033457.1 ABC transporter ATP-binding protein [Nitrospira tepida]